MYSPLSLFSSALLLFSSISSASVGTEPQTLVVDTFSVTKGNRVPYGWRPSRNDISMFSVKQENQNSFTRIFTKGGCTSLGKLFRFSAQKYPHLSWRWRINQLPEGGNETIKDKNDSGASVYIVFKGNFKLNNILKYVWSSSLPVGTVISSPYNKNAKIIVLRSGNEEAGKWVSERVDIRADYKRLFGKEPPPVEGIAILSDSDNTNSIASADYDDFEVKAMN